VAKFDLSVVIPTRNRAESLAKCLDSLEHGVGRSNTEVIVVDDCSTDQTAQVLASRDWVRSVHLEAPSGSSAARNAALRKAGGDVVLFTDDDISVETDLIDRHIEFHHINRDEHDALLGLVTWDKTQPITGHMLWLEEGGPLFAFDRIEDPSDVAPEHFCTANVSVKRSLLGQLEGPFTPELPRFTDVDLGLRLAKLGMKLQFDSNAVAWHMRHDTPATTDQRMFVVGQAAHKMLELHGELSAVPAPPKIGALADLKVLVARGLTPFTGLLGKRVAGRVWSVRAASSYGRGWRSVA